MSLNQNEIPNEDVQLMDVLNMFGKQLKLALNCHHIGTIQSFDSATQTAKVKISYKKTYLKRNPKGVYNLEAADYPIMADVPVLFLGGGETGALTFPVQAGDECLLLFNDRDIDNWYSGNSNAPPSSSRLHSFSDGIALVGMRSKTKAISDFDADAVSLRFGDNKILVKESEVIVQLSETVSLKLTSAGKFAVTNETGEFVNALLQFFQTASAGGYPIVGDLTTLQSFLEV